MITAFRGRRLLLPDWLGASRSVFREPGLRGWPRPGAGHAYKAVGVHPANHAVADPTKYRLGVTPLRQLRFESSATSEFSLAKSLVDDSQILPGFRQRERGDTLLQDPAGLLPLTVTRQQHPPIRWLP